MVTDLSIDLFIDAVLMQKLEYIHWNPVAGLCHFSEENKYSSAGFYLTWGE